MDIRADLVDVDQHWDYANPAKTEKIFRELLLTAPPNSSYRAELLTQLARTQGLQRKFAEAHLILDEVDALATDELLTNAMSVVRIRSLLERGRTFNSSGQPEKGRQQFLDAWELGCATGEDFHAIDAAHMMAIVEPADKQHSWNLEALALTEATPDQRAKKWLGSLYNNIGWTYHDQERYDEALASFEKALLARKDQGDAELIGIAHWCIARCLRSLGRIEEALKMQRQLYTESTARGEKDGYTCEELGECLLHLGQGDEARPFFAQAYEILSQDQWLVEHESARLERLQQVSRA